MFRYNELFQRNIGIISKNDREKLKKSKIALLGVGGVGGRFAESLTRLGCENLLIADNGYFDPPDLNRQFSSSVHNLGKSKVSCVKKDLLAINPNLNLIAIKSGITHKNYKEIIDASDLILDGIDINFGIIKQMVNMYAYNNNKVVITSLLVGHGAICLIFNKRKGISHDEYFGLSPNESQKIFLKKFINGIYPNPTSDEYYNDAGIKLMNGMGHIPSSTANTFIAGALVTMAVRSVLLGRPKIPIVPFYQQIDLFDMKYYVKRYDYKINQKNCSE